MAHWNYTLRLKDIFNDDDIPFERKRDEIVRRIREAPFWDEDDTELVELTEELAMSPTEDDFDNFWDQFYNWADVERVWVATF